MVLYVGTQAIAYVHSKGITPSTGTIAHTAHMDIFQHLVVDLDTEGKILLNLARWCSIKVHLHAAYTIINDFMDILECSLWSVE